MPNNLKKPAAPAVALTVGLLTFNCLTFTTALPVKAADPPAAITPQVVSVSSSSTTTQTPQSNVSISSGTTHVIDVSNGPVHRLTGNLTNLGVLYIISTNPNVSAAVISARNIFNGPGATISSVLPAGGILGYESAIPNLSLTLTAIQSIVNRGTISSANNLTMVAGGSISNISTSGSLATLQAANNLNLLAPSIANSGLIVAQMGNVNLANPSVYTATVNQLGLNIASTLGQIVNINNTSGIIQALNGAVNIGGSAFSSKAVLSMVGGEASGSTINFDGGAGAVNAFLDKVNGVVNLQAGAAQFGTTNQAGTLTLGDLKVDGDPTYFNTSGNIDIIGPVSAQANLAILASGSITATLGPQTITTTDGTGQGHDLYMIAGATLAVSGGTNSGTLPSLFPLPAGQKVTVIGQSAQGGSISLNDSIIDTRSGGGDKAGGSVTLIAYPGFLLGNDGGVEKMTILTGGSGSASNGSVSIIAGGRVGLSNVAVDNVRIDSGDKSSSKVGASVSILAAVPVLFNAVFDSTGTVSPTAKFSGGNLTPFDININQIVKTDSGAIKIATDGKLTTTAEISSSGLSSGRNAGDITLIGSSIDIGARLLAAGANGANGADAAQSKTGGVAPIGGAGVAGGNGGSIHLEATGTTTGININADILADGGTGGKGGKGADGSSNKQAGGAGGAGGNGGNAGKVELLTTKNTQINQGFSLISILGGSAGSGGAGGAGGTSPILTGAAGGAGGSAGTAMLGGSLTAKSGNGAQVFNGTVDARGGNGGNGGVGAAGVAGSSRGGTGGKSGRTSSGAGGGSVELITTGGDITLTIANVSGGNGGFAGNGGAGGAGAVGGVGGSVQDSGSGGDGGRVSLSSTTGSLNLITAATLSGGTGADLQGNSGDGGAGTTKGGDGGSLFNAGSGGAGGMFSALSNGTISISGEVNADGGIAGSVTGTGGKGGVGTTGGRGGGLLGNSGSGGRGGRVEIVSKSSSVTITGMINANGSNAGGVFGNAGDGGKSTAGGGGAGGAIGNSGDGGDGGAIKVASKIGALSFVNVMNARGGNGGDITGKAGAGGDGKKAGGFGGDVFDAGNGGPGGSITIEGTGNIDLFNFDAFGGAGGGQFGSGGNGGDGNTGGRGGSIGKSGDGGRGGRLSIKTTQDAGLGTVSFNEKRVDISGGASGQYNATGGDGGAGGLTAAGAGGQGGALGDQGSGGEGGKAFITCSDLYMFTQTLTAPGSLLANGGKSPGYNTAFGQSGNGGSSSNGDGGSGGSVGVAGNGGRGGYISIDVKSTVVVENTIPLDPQDPLFQQSVDSLAARGGHVLTNDVRSGAGGNGAAQGDGGNGGNIGSNGSAGSGGEIFIKGGAGDMSGKGVIVVAGGHVNIFSGDSGKGGDAGDFGRGGNSGSFLNSRFNASNGNGGEGGLISISSTSGKILLAPLIAPGGDVETGFGVVTGDGGKGGTFKGNGGDSGSVGNNGSGGPGGQIKLVSQSGQIGYGTNDMPPYISHAGPIGIAAPITGDGGSATIGNGGNSGRIGNNGTPGKGGQVIVITMEGNIFTPKGTIGAAGADGGLWLAKTGKGGDTLDGVAGTSGSIGVNSSGAKGGEVKLNAAKGNITINGVIVIPGGAGNGSFAITGDAGSAVKGAGGASGSIGNGGSGGEGGKLEVLAGGDVFMSEAIIADGGFASVLPYDVSTGNGGNGTLKGGGSGDVGKAGDGGRGGNVSIKAGGNMDLDRIYVNGGRAGFVLVDPVTFVETVLFDGAMANKTGNGGKAVGANGIAGSAGKIGSATSGGVGGNITIEAGKNINTSVFYKSNGGYGANQNSVGGKGGDGDQKGGAGGEVGAAGSGGNGGIIKLTAVVGPLLTVKELSAFGGDGGDNNGISGDGGNAAGAVTKSGTFAAGNGGALLGSGAGGIGGTVEITLKNELLPPDPNAKISVTGNLGFTIYGGAAGIMAGQAGDGGSGLELTKSIKGGEGGSAGETGAGGQGGSLTVKVKSGSMDFPHVLLDGGAAGDYIAKAGTGGAGTLNEVGGAGGSLGAQKSAGKGGTLNFEGGTMTVPATFVVSTSGGHAPTYFSNAADGGDGGVKGGAGGSVGSAGSGGEGGKIVISASKAVVIDGELRSNGGDRLGINQIAGNAGDGGVNSKSLVTGNGGRGGDVFFPGSGGAAGTVVISTLNGSVPVQGGPAGLISASGGSSIGATMVAGDGGSAKVSGAGGDGGSVKGGPGGGKGGHVIITTLGGDIAIPNYSVFGGSVNGDFVATGGDGGNSVSGKAGAGGRVEDAGSAGDGSPEFKLVSGGSIIIDGVLDGHGGSVGNMVAQGGKGGSASSLQGGGGIGGGVGSNGNAGSGMGGAIDASKSEFKASLGFDAKGSWSLNGGNVGVYDGHSGAGGDGAPVVTGPPKSLGGEAGGSGKIGNNGKAGGGGKITVTTEGLDVNFAQDLNANGGNVGIYSGTTANGGNGGKAGGDAGAMGDNGAAGAGGSVKIDSKGLGAITTQAISVSAGTVAMHNGKGGNGGTSGSQSGGEGGTRGEGGSGGAGGSIDLHASKAAITVNGNLLANASDGGAAGGLGGNGGNGFVKGGGGGTLASSGAGGAGGNIKLYAESADVSVTGSVSANHGAGGAQGGTAGKGADSTIDTAGNDNVGGDGGTVRKGGAAGTVGATIPTGITLISDSGNVTVTGDVTTNGAKGGSINAIAGAGGNGPDRGGNGGAIESSGDGVIGGKIVLQANKTSGTLSVGGNISANGGAGGDQQGAAGAGGNGTSKVKSVGGEGGSVRVAGEGQNGGTIILDYSIKAVTGTITVDLGGPGARSATAGLGGTGVTPGPNGKVDVQPPPHAQNGTIIENGALILGPWPEDNFEDHELKKRKQRPVYIAFGSGKQQQYGDLIALPEQETELKEIGYIQAIAPPAVQDALHDMAIRSAVANLVEQDLCTDELKQRLAKSGVSVKSNGHDGFVLERGAVMYAPTNRKAQVQTKHGVIEIAAGSKAIVEVTDDSTIVRTLHDHKQGDVRVLVGDKHFEVNLGKQLLVTTSDRSISDFSRESGIAHRNATSKQLANGLTVHTSEFSVVSALSNDQILKALCASSAKSDRKHFVQIAKNACILSSMTMLKGPYKQ